MTIQTLLVANRGEIAVRIIRAAKEMGIRTVQVYSEADSESLAVRLADTSVCIGAPMANQSYLDGSKIIQAALDSGADAIHPGYGFLSENADFSDQVRQAGLVFVEYPTETPCARWRIKRLPVKRLKPQACLWCPEAPQ